MKALFIGLTISLSVAHAQTNTFECDNKALVLSESCLSYRYVDCYATKTELTINDKEITSYFETSGGLRTSSDGSFITSNLIEKTSTTTSFKTTANGLPVLLKLEKLSEGATLFAFNYQEIPGPHGVRVELSAPLAQWTFKSCK